MDERHGDIYSNLGKLKWASDPMTLLQLIESLEMPQIGRISQSNISDLRENDYLLLQSVYDRYVILGKGPSSQSFIIPDWYRANCKVRSSNPRIQRQFWNFQGASEINRFDLPREINFLIETPLYQFTHKSGAKLECKKVVLKRNTKLVVTKVQNYAVDSVQRGTCFILVDKQGNKFLLPSEFSVKFSVEIKPEEYNKSYFDNKGLFSLPEIITRYELPVEIEFSAANESGSVPASKLIHHPLKLTSVAIAKSIVGAVFDSNLKKFRYIELSPATKIKLSIPKCLKHGLLNPNAILTKEEENEYSLYNKTREAALGLCHKQCELFKFDLRSASSEEKDAMAKIYELGTDFKRAELNQLKNQYLLDLKSKEAENPDAKIPFISLKNIFLRPNIDEGDPYDDVTQENDDGGVAFCHDMSILSQMPEKLLINSLTDIENSPKKSSRKGSK